MRKTKAIQFGLLSLALSAMALQMPSLAAATYYSGSSCRPYDPWGTDTVLYADGTQLKNNSSSVRQVFCLPDREAQGNVSYAQVLATGSVSCNMFVKKWDGSSLVMHYDSGVQTFSTYRRIPFFAGTAVGTSGAGDMWGFLCTLQPGSSILSFELNEG